LRVELATLSGGCILWDIIDHMNQKRGSTLNALLAALEAKSVHPNGELPFASAIIFELWRNENGNFEVVVRLRDESLGVTLKTITRSVGGCEVSDACSWETFKKRSQPFNPGDIKQEIATQRSCQMIKWNSGTIIESPVRTYTIPDVLTSGTEQSHATLNNLYPFKHVPPVNVRLWNEEDRKRVIFDPDVTDTFESFNLESTIEEVMNASTQSDEVTEVGRTRLFVQTPKPLDERLTNHNVAIQSVTTDYWPANGMFELKNFIFYPFKTSSTIQNPLRNST
uniref:Uncharacterized protein n=1 Tax=Toxocara canis TaxID=6265 RepID=A0A183TZS4_TOXCA